VLVSLITPRTIVSVGDSYCWDLWCVGVQQVNATAQGANTLYTADVTVNPGESVEASLSFVAPANAGKLYLMGKEGVMMPWLYMGFGSDVSLFHRRTLLRVL